MSIEIPTPAQVNEFLVQAFPAASGAGVVCTDIGPGFVMTRWRYDPATLRPGGLISGPTQFAVADTALWFLSFTVLGLAPMAVTSEINISFLRPAVGADLIARGELLRAGRSKITGTVRLWVDGAPDKPVSHAVGSYMRLG